MAGLIFTCKLCGRVFESEATDEEANAEAFALWGVKAASTQPSMDVICDSCFERIKPSAR